MCGGGGRRIFETVNWVGKVKMLWFSNSLINSLKWKRVKHLTIQKGEGGHKKNIMMSYVWEKDGDVEVHMYMWTWDQWPRHKWGIVLAGVCELLDKCDSAWGFSLFLQWNSCFVMEKPGVEVWLVICVGILVIPGETWLQTRATGGGAITKDCPIVRF